jgi:hypothetical protein
MAVLRKRHVEQLLSDYDTDPVGALTTAMRIVLDRPDADFRSLVLAAPFDADRRDRLLAEEVAQLDELARELNETRMLPTQGRS